MLIPEFVRNPNPQNYKTNFRNHDNRPRATPWHEGSGEGLVFVDRGEFVAKGFGEPVQCMS